MFLHIKNLGLIDVAEIELNGITVIAGKNNTGKSTVSKALFCIASSFYDAENVIRLERFEAILHRTSSDIANFVYENENDIKKDMEQLRRVMTDHYQHFFSFDGENVDGEGVKEHVDGLLEEIGKLMATSDIAVMRGMLSRKFKAEFGIQMHNLYRGSNLSEVTLDIVAREINVKIENNQIGEISDITGTSTEVIYIDDPFILDNLNQLSRRNLFYRSQSSRREHLRRLLDDGQKNRSVIDEVLTSTKLDKILELINKICPGDMETRTRVGTTFIDGHSGKISMANVSTGLKSFIIIKTLLLNGQLKDGGIIILDEPEIHLHPEWQIVFAELIVLLQKQFNMRILINTHSPYFMMALEDYSVFHNIADKCRYYLMESNGKIATTKDVSNNTKEVYKKFLKPIQELEDRRYKHD